MREATEAPLDRIHEMRRALDESWGSEPAYVPAWGGSAQEGSAPRLYALVGALANRVVEPTDASERIVPAARPVVRPVAAGRTFERYSVFLRTPARQPWNLPHELLRNSDIGQSRFSVR